MLRYLSVLVLSASLVGCSDIGDQYDDATEGYSASEWKSSYVWSNIGTGFLFNAIPTIHLIGLIVDTFIVYDSLDGIIYGHGAIIA